MKIDKFKLCPIEPMVRIKAFCSAHSGIRPVGYFYSGESHDFWESVFILKGRAGITAGETVYTLEEGQMIFHPPGEFHRIWNEGDDFLRVVIVSFSVEYFPLEKHQICRFRPDDRVFSVVRDIRKIFVTDGIFLRALREPIDPVRVHKAVSNLENLFVELLGQVIEDLSINVRRDKFSSLYSTAIGVMKDNMSVRLSASDIAGTCGMSISTMQKLFRIYTGMGMMKYYESVRMQHARSLLEKGRMVKEVAIELGYHDQNYFSTAYKRFFGVSPRN